MGIIDQYIERYKNRGKTAEIPPSAVTFTREYWEKVANLKDPDNGPLPFDTIWRVLKRKADELLTQRGRTFIVDAGNRDFLNTLCLYFSRSEDFEKKDDFFSLNKGLFIRGDCGVGKTFPLFLLSGFPGTFKTANMFNCNEINRSYQASGPTGLGRVISYPLDDLPVVLDELSEWSMVNYMGTPVNVMAQVIDHRYRLFIGHGTVTHITTNIVSAEDIERFYGSRIRSRIREMFNVITVTGPDRRN